MSGDIREVVAGCQASLELIKAFEYVTAQLMEAAMSNLSVVQGSPKSTSGTVTATPAYPCQHRHSILIISACWNLSGNPHAPPLYSQGVHEDHAYST